MRLCETTTSVARWALRARAGPQIDLRRPFPLGFGLVNQFLSPGGKGGAQQLGVSLQVASWRNNAYSPPQPPSDAMCHPSSTWFKSAIFEHVERQARKGGGAGLRPTTQRMEGKLSIAAFPLPPFPLPSPRKTSETTFDVEPRHETTPAATYRLCQTKSL